MKEHKDDYLKFLKFREIEISKNVKCLWCKDPTISLEEAFFQNEDVEPTLNLIKKCLYHGYSNRRIYQELKSTYGPDILFPNYLAQSCFGIILFCTSLFLLKPQTWVHLRKIPLFFKFEKKMKHQK